MKSPRTSRAKTADFVVDGDTPEIIPNDGLADHEVVEEMIRVYEKRGLMLFDDFSRMAASELLNHWKGIAPVSAENIDAIDINNLSKDECRSLIQIINKAQGAPLRPGGRSTLHEEMDIAASPTER